MGVSNDAIIAYGLDLGEEIPEGLQALYDQHEVDGFEELIDALTGIAKEDWVTRFRARDNFPVELIGHCSYDYPMYFLAIRGTQKRASRGCPEPVSIDHFKISNEQIIAFNRFCVDIGVDPAEAYWQIFSMNG